MAEVTSNLDVTLYGTGEQTVTFTSAASGLPTVSGSANVDVSSPYVPAANPSPSTSPGPSPSPVPPKTAAGSTQPVSAGALVAGAAGGGYWLAQPDGAVSAFGGAQSYGSAAACRW